VTRPASRSAVVLGALTALFGCRVAGQALVAFLGVTWLPPMDVWFSGLLPYRLLLPLQIVILFVQIVIDRDLWRGQGSSRVPGRAPAGGSSGSRTPMRCRWSSAT